MIIKWLNEAAADLHHLHHYLTDKNPSAAKNMGKRLIEAVNLLKQQPGIGRPGRVFDTRELVVTATPFIIPYQVKHNVIVILRVLHCAMLWPDKLP